MSCSADLVDVMRRILDVLVSVFGLVFLSPLLLAIGIGVRKDSPGPAIFQQERVGRAGTPFTLYKFRTMTVNSGSGPAVTAATDTRVTNLGAKLRAAKLDELPQLANVLKGDMSLVGPRPEVPRYVALWPSDLTPVILSVRPGITDPVTVQLRDEEKLLAEADDPEEYYRLELLPAKAAAYAQYVRSRTLLSDLKVLVNTAVAIVRGGNPEPSVGGAPAPSGGEAAAA